MAMKGIMTFPTAYGMAPAEFAQAASPPLLVFANLCQPDATPRIPSQRVHETQAFHVGSGGLQIRL